MTNQSLPTTTSDAFIAAILDTLRAHFTGQEIQIGYGESLDEYGNPMPFNPPWLLLQVAPLRANTDGIQRPGLTAMSYRCSLQCALSTRTEALQIALTAFATHVLAFVSAWESPPVRDRDGKPVPGQRWGLGRAVEPATNFSSTKDTASVPQGHDAFMIEWDQIVYIDPVA